MYFFTRSVEDLDEYISTLKEQCEVNPKDVAAEKIRERNAAKQLEKEKRRLQKEEQRKLDEEKEKQAKARKGRRQKKKGGLRF